MRRMAFRVLASLLVVASTYYFVFWISFSLIFAKHRSIAGLVSSFCAVGAGWFVWSRSGAASGAFVSNVFYGALLLGGIGFSAGFFGPMIFAPEANQGPLLGLFITGPLGFLLGGVGGLFYWLIRGRRGGRK